MKWIGQHIYDLASRFRSDVYLESISSGTIASGAHLGLDSNNKIVKAVDGGGDLTSIVAGTGLSGTSLTGPIPTLNVDASQPTITTLAGLTALGTNGVGTVFSGNSFQLINTEASSATQGGGRLQLASNDGAAMGDDHRLGIINFIAAEDASSTYVAGASIAAYADAAWSSTENGTRLLFRTMDGNASGQNVLTLDSDKLATFTGGVTVTGDHLKIATSTSTFPLVQLKNETNDASGPRLKFNKLRGADGQDGDSCGIIQFASFDDGTPSTQFYGQIETKIADATSGQEAGDMFFQVPSYDGVLTSGLIIRGDTDADGEVDVNIAAGAASTTTIAGILTMGSTATINNSGVVQVAAQTVIDHDQLANFAANEHFTQANITTVGTISTGEWRGTVINGAYIDDDAIDGDSIADDAVDSEHYTDGSIDTAHIADDQVTFAKAIGVSPKVYGTKIKILPSDFMSNDDGGSTKFGIGFVEADGTGFGMKIPNASTELLAFVSIPEGMKATHVDIFDQEDDRVIEVFEANINSRTITSKGSGNCNTTLDITDVNATAVNYLLILVTTTATSDRVYGGTITIAAQ